MDGEEVEKVTPKTGLILLDLMLPHLDAWKCAGRTRRKEAELPS